jgi:hypothetical protein
MAVVKRGRPDYRGEAASWEAPTSAAIQIKESAVNLDLLAPIGLAILITIMGKRWI